MRFLHLIRPRFVLAAGLLFLSLPIRAADESSSQPTNTGEEVVDMAKVQSGGRVAFVTSGQRPAVLHVIDDDRRTVFQFSESESHPTLIVKLNETQQVRRVSLVPGSEALQVNIYLLDQLPRKGSDLGSLKPVTSIVNLVVGREAAADFAPQNAHYVVLRWILAAPFAGSVKVAEVSAFAQTDSHRPTDLLAAADPANSFQVIGPPDVAVVSP
jgi:hypothetical protein